MVDRVTAPASADPRAGSDSALEVRLAALANALGRTLRDLRDRVESGERRMAERIGAIEGSLAESVEAIERRVADIPDITAQTTTDLRAVLRHLEALQQRVGAPPPDISEKIARIETRLSAVPGSVAERVDEATEGMRKSFEALPTAFAQSLEPFRGLPKRIEEAMDAVEEMRNRVAALEGGIQRVRDESESSLVELRETITERFETMAGLLAQEVKRLTERAASDERLEGVEKRIEAMAQRIVDPEELASRATEATEAALTRADLGTIARAATESALDTYGKEQARRSDALEKALSRVDKLSEALGSLEKRRGARELLEGEQKLLEQQESLVRTVTETANSLAGRVLSIEGDINSILERVDDERLSREIGEHIKESVAELRETISHDLGVRLSQAIAAISKVAADRVATDVGGRVENLREQLAEDASRVGTEIFETASSEMAEELRAMRAKIDSWGKARTSPKVAEEISAMGKRIDRMAVTVESELVDAVFDRMQRVFDRRFEVLIQLVESRIREAVPKTEEPSPSHRRRFLRRTDED